MRAAQTGTERCKHIAGRAHWLFIGALLVATSVMLCPTPTDATVRDNNVE